MTSESITRESHTSTINCKIKKSKDLSDLRYSCVLWIWTWEYYENDKNKKFMKLSCKEIDIELIDKNGSLFQNTSCSMQHAADQLTYVWD